VQDRNRITAGGITAGVDFGLRVAAELRGEDYARCLTLAHTGLRPIQVREPQDDLAAGWFLVLLAHIRGLHTAGMHTLEQALVLRRNVEKRPGDLTLLEAGYPKAVERRILWPITNPFGASAQG
jgi:hypothetical protein